MSQSQIKVYILQEQGLPLFNTSITDYSKKLQRVLNKLQKKGELITVFERQIGRSPYLLAVVSEPVEPAQVQDSPAVALEPETGGAKSRKSKKSVSVARS